MNYQDVIDGINEVMNREIPMLLSLTDEQVSVKRNRQNRTAKMLVGHLIDSASNNHQRMVRLQYAPRCGHSMPNTEMGMLVFPDMASVCCNRCDSFGIRYCRSLCAVCHRRHPSVVFAALRHYSNCYSLCLKSRHRIRLSPLVVLLS